MFIVALALTLAYPRDPTSGRIATFKGFIAVSNAFETSSIFDYLSISGRSLYAANATNGKVYKVPLSAGRLPNASDIMVMSDTQSQAAAHGTAVDPVSGRAFVTLSGQNTVDVFDVASGRLIKRIPVTADCDAILYDAATRHIYVASGESQTATLIDPESVSVLGTIALGGRPEYAAIDARHNLLYQNLQSTNEMVAIDLAKWAIVARYPIADCEEPTAMAIDPAEQRLFTTCGKTGRLKIFDLEKHNIVASLDIGGSPDSIVYDAASKYLFITGLSGVVTIVAQTNPNKYRVIDTFSTRYGAHSLAYDAVNKRLYIAYAGVIFAPRIAVYEVKTVN